MTDVIGPETRKVGEGSNVARLATLRCELGEAQAAGDSKGVADRTAEIAGLIPDDALAQRIASQSCLVLDDLPTAVYFARRANSAEGEHDGHRLYFAGLQNRTSDYAGALITLGPLFEAGNATPEVSLQGAQALLNLGEGCMAIDLVQSAIEADPARASSGMFLASIYARMRDWANAVQALKATEVRSGKTAVTRRGISGYLAQLGEHEEALSAIEDAMGMAGEMPDYRLHRMGLLRHLMRIDEALEELKKLITADPTNQHARRLIVSFYIERGDVVSALEHGGQLLAQAPENKEFQTCMTFLLNAYQGHQLAEDVGDIASLKGNGPVRGYRPPAPLRVQLRSFFNVIWALVLREVLARHGRNRLGFFWAVLEPVVHIALLAVVFQLFLRIPPLGDNFFFFYFTGIVPYLLLSRVANEAGNAVMSNRNTMQIPLISPLELVIAKLLVELFTVSIMILVFGSAFVLLGWSGLPSEPGKVLGGLCMAALVGLGIGMIYASAQEFGRFAATLIFLILRLLYFTGGIFFVPEMIPQAYRELAAWNPLLHIVQLVREGAYPNYAPIDMDVGYPVLTIVLTLGVGIVFLKAVTPLMRVQK